MVRRVRFGYHKACIGLIEVLRVCFDKRKACRRLLAFRKVLLTTAKRVVGL